MHRKTEKEKNVYTNKQTMKRRGKKNRKQFVWSCAVRDAAESELSNSLEKIQQCALSQNKSTDDTKREMGNKQQELHTNSNEQKHQQQKQQSQERRTKWQQSKNVECIACVCVHVFCVCVSERERERENLCSIIINYYSMLLKNVKMWDAFIHTCLRASTNRCGVVREQSIINHCILYAISPVVSFLIHLPRHSLIHFFVFIVVMIIIIKLCVILKTFWCAWPSHTAFTSPTLLSDCYSWLRCCRCFLNKSINLCECKWIANRITISHRVCVCVCSSCIWHSLNQDQFPFMIVFATFHQYLWCWGY